MKIGFLTASLSRRGGGLYDATRMLAQGLTESQGDKLEVFGLQDVYTERDLGGWSGIDTHALPTSGPASLGYAPALTGLLNRSAIDLLHSHGLWMYPSRASLKWARSSKKPYVISPHGMLDAWAVRNSKWKKRVAGWLYEDAHLRRASCLHALCEAEYQAIRAYGLKNPVCVIPNGVVPPEIQEPRRAAWTSSLPADARVLLYLGRIHPKKGLANLLVAWKLARQRSGSGTPWMLVIAGWDQGGHEAELKQLADTLGIDGSVVFAGPQFDVAKHATYASADAFVLPSFSEGLPMVVLEAWAHSLPVLMTPQCNLPEGFATGAAIQVLPEVDSIAAGLVSLFETSVQDRLATGMRGRALVEAKFTWAKIAAQMHEIYSWLLGHGGCPECVKTA